jgi:hypothetical protein
LGGGDEINRRKVDNYLTIFVDLTAKVVLFATLGKGSSVWEAVSAELLLQNCHPKVNHVALVLGPLDGEGSLKERIDGAGTVCCGHGL